MKRRFALFLLAAGLFLTSCGRYVPPGEGQLQGTFTAAFLEQLTRVPAEQAQFFVDGVSLEWQYLDGETAISCCQVSMSSRQYRCQVETLLTHVHQEDGTWALEGWTMGDSVLQPIEEAP